MRDGYWVASKRVTGPRPDSPASVAFQNSSVPRPLGAVIPRPVTTAVVMTVLLSGRASTMALWNPPNPLPTLSTTSVCCSRATSGM